ncbi:MAG TPA: PEP-CTERM sorting domain-containing protein [Terriglobales bacterium]|nr:PEP-CTERM sorting domain-containing protein [Terriglobales bacterium]
MKKTFLGVVVLCGCLLLTVSAFAGTYGFDDLTPFTVPPSGYAQIQTWNGSFEVINRDCCNGTQSGYWNNNISPNNELFDPFGAPAQLGAKGDPTFTLTSFWTGAAWNDGENLSIIGLFNGTQLFSTNVTIGTQTPTFVSLNWSGINEVDFTPSGGTNHGYNGSGEHFIIDDLTINGSGGQVPEPASLFLLGSGLVTLGGIARKRMNKD